MRECGAPGMNQPAGAWWVGRTSQQHIAVGPALAMRFPALVTSAVRYAMQLCKTLWAAVVRVVTCEPRVFATYIGRRQQGHSCAHARAPASIFCAVRPRQRRVSCVPARTSSGEHNWQMNTSAASLYNPLTSVSVIYTVDNKHRQKIQSRVTVTHPQIILDSERACPSSRAHPSRMPGPYNILEIYSYHLVQYRDVGHTIASALWKHRPPETFVGLPRARSPATLEASA